MEATKEKHATHTPGPWYDSGNPEYEIYKGNKPIASVIPSFTAEDDANARLIAAAPELLEQCKLFEKVLTHLINSGDRKFGADLERNKRHFQFCVREVLAKVEGGEG